MVVFTCSKCGDSLAKPKVEKHLYLCRTNALSCMDCQKDFTAESYKKHTKCISEAEKYHGSAAKRGKGEKKQEKWLELLSEVVTNWTGPGDTKEFLQQVVATENVPRKKRQFKNFMRSSFPRTGEEKVDEVWDVFARCLEQSKAEAENAKKAEEVNGEREKSHKTEKDEEVKNVENEAEVEKMEVEGEKHEVDGKEKKKKRKSKKGKASEVVVEVEEKPVKEDEEEEPPKKKGKKRAKVNDEKEKAAEETNGDVKELKFEEQAIIDILNSFDWKPLIEEFTSSDSGSKHTRKKIYRAFMKQSTLEEYIMKTVDDKLVEKA